MNQKLYFLEIEPSEIPVPVCKDTCMLIFIALLSIITGKKMQFKCKKQSKQTNKYNGLTAIREKRMALDCLASQTAPISEMFNNFSLATVS